jgi:hypothetical protein
VAITKNASPASNAAANLVLGASKKAKIWNCTR